MPAVNYVIYGCVAPLREQLQELSLYRGFSLEESIVTGITHNRVTDDKLKRQIKNRTLNTCRLFLLTLIFSNWSKLFGHSYPSLSSI